MSEQHAPKVFISYSWSSDDYVEQVIDFVEDLRDHHVEVVFDQLDLTEGQDKHQYMERAVADPTVDRVLILCDPIYADKADGRSGGVGTETLIISGKVYADARQERFLPVIMARDGDEVRVPTYLNGRKYFDLTGPDRIVHFQRLIRRLHGKPDLERKPLGPRPSFLEEKRPELRTGRLLDIFKDTVEREKGHQTVRLEEYLDRLADIIPQETAIPDERPEILDEWAVTTIHRMKPYRDEFSDLMWFVARYDESGKFALSLHTFFERLLTARRQLRERFFGEQLEETPLAFLTWEMFLIAVAALLRKERVQHVTALFESYHAPTDPFSNAAALQGFESLDPGFRLIDEVRKSRLRLTRESVSADMIRERATQPDLAVAYLMEADLFCWLRSVLSTETRYWSWYPRLLVFAKHTGVSPLFERATSISVFKRLTPALGVHDRAELLARWEAIGNGMFEGPGSLWGGRQRYANLVNLDALGTRA